MSFKYKKLNKRWPQTIFALQISNFYTMSIQKARRSHYTFPQLLQTLRYLKLLYFTKTCFFAHFFILTFRERSKYSCCIKSPWSVFHLDLLQCFVYKLIMPSFPCFSSSNVSIHNIHNIVSCICTSLAFWQLF